jgi:hypothetical protein
MADDLVPFEVTERLGITPSLAYVKGEIWKIGQRSGRPYVGRTGMWQLRTTLPDTSALDEHIRSLLKLLLPRASEIRAFVDRGYKADFSCGIFLEHDNEGTELEAETVAGIAALGAKLGLDIYALFDDDDEPPPKSPTA